MLTGLIVFVVVMFAIFLVVVVPAAITGKNPITGKRL